MGTPSTLKCKKKKKKANSLVVGDRCILLTQFLSKLGITRELPGALRVLGVQSEGPVNPSGACLAGRQGSRLLGRSSSRGGCRSRQEGQKALSASAETKRQDLAH